MDEGNVDICDETSNADKDIEKSNGDKESSDSEAFLQDRNGANEFELENDFNRPISAIAVDASTSSEDMVLIARGTATGSVEQEQIGDRIVTNVESQKVHAHLVENGASKSTYNGAFGSLDKISFKTDLNHNHIHSVDLETKYIDQKTLDLEKRLNDLLADDTFNALNIDDPGLKSKIQDFEDDIDIVLEKLLSEAPKVPSDSQDLVNSFDEQSLSATSSKSLSKSYIYSSASTVDGSQDIPDKNTNYGDKQILVPKYKADGSGYCWPIDRLPLSGTGSFDEGQQWTTASTNPLGRGASGECFIGYTVKKQDKKLLDDIGNIFCVKKLFHHKYNREEVFSLYLAGKDQHDQKQTGSINIVPFYGATYWKENVCIFMELMEAGPGISSRAVIGGTVEELLEDFELQKDNYLCYLNDVLSGLAFLHGKGIVHNDIKAGNVLLDRNKFHAKLADFGNASPIYNNDNSKRKDILSAGCFLLEMLGNFMKPNKILTLKLSCTSGCAENLPQHNDSDTNAILHMFFGATSDKNTAFYIAKQLNVFCKAG